MAVLRSRKYSQLDDSDILKLYAQEPIGESFHFLQIEIEQRNLENQAAAVIDTKRKNERHSVLYYLFYFVMFVFFVATFGKDFI